MPEELRPGGRFPDLELPDHSGNTATARLARSWTSRVKFGTRTIGMRAGKAVLRFLRAVRRLVSSAGQSE